MVVGTVSTTLALDGAAAFGAAVKMAVTDSWAVAMSSFEGIGSTERSTDGSSVIAAVVALAGGSISIARLRLPVTLGTQSIVAQWGPTLPPAPELSPADCDLRPAHPGERRCRGEKQERRELHGHENVQLARTTKPSLPCARASNTIGFN